MRRITLTLMLLPPAIVAIALLPGRLLSHSQAPDMHLAAALSFVFFFSLFAYASVAFVALPALVLLARMGRVTLWAAALVGSAAALLVPAVSVAAQAFDSGLHLAYRVQQVWELWPFALAGAVSGVAFWLLALWRNPLVEMWNQRSTSSALRDAT